MQIDHDDANELFLRVHGSSPSRHHTIISRTFLKNHQASRGIVGHAMLAGMQAAVHSKVGEGEEREDYVHHR